MAFTEPLYAAPIVLDGTETIAIDMTPGSTSADFTATLNSGTYYNHINADTGGLSSFGVEVVRALDAGETAGATWAWSTVGSGLSFRVQLDRTGAASDVLVSITFSGIGGTTHLGASAGDTITEATDDELTNTGVNSSLVCDYQRGYIWLPREILTVDYRSSVATVASASTNAGATVVDGYGSHDRYLHRIPFVPAAAVFVDKAADSDFASAITSMTAGDTNVPLQTFWKVLNSYTGAGKVCYYVPDSGTVGTSTAVVFADSDWLADLDSVAKEQASSPALYEITLRCQESV